MRKLLLMLLVVLFGSTQSVSAQSFKEGCQWSYYANCYIRAENKYVLYFTKFELKEAYELNGKTYNRLYSTLFDEYGNTEEPVALLGLREEAGKVYADYDEFLRFVPFFISGAGKYDEHVMAHPVTDDNEVILYDFTLAEGDYFGPTDIFITTYVENKTDALMETGEKRDVLEMWRTVKYEDDFDDSEDFGDSTDWDRLISGVGSVNNLLYWLCWIPVSGNEIVQSQLNVYVEGNKVVYKAPEYTGNPDLEYKSSTTYKKDPFFDNLVTGISNVKSDAGRDVKPCLYDLSGRKIEGRPRPGVYIKNSKKVVIK